MAVSGFPDRFEARQCLSGAPLTVLNISAIRYGGA